MTDRSYPILRRCVTAAKVQETVPARAALMASRGPISNRLRLPLRLPVKRWSTDERQGK